MTIEHTSAYIHAVLNTPCRTLSSAVLNGGLTETDHLLNLKVPSSVPAGSSAEDTLLEFSESKGWQGTVVGMMTAASMDSYRIRAKQVQEVDMAVLLTAGLSNPRRTGDRAEFRDLTEGPGETGTINIMALTSAAMTDAALTEALMIVTESKAAVLQDAQITSPVSGKIATGTGTDSTAVVCGLASPRVCYCGKHTRMGEVLGRLVMDALSDSLEWYADQKMNPFGPSV